MVSTVIILVIVFSWGTDVSVCIVEVGFTVVARYAEGCSRVGVLVRVHLKY